MLRPEEKQEHVNFAPDISSKARVATRPITQMEQRLREKSFIQLLSVFQSESCESQLVTLHQRTKQDRGGSNSSVASKLSFRADEIWLVVVVELCFYSLDQRDAM